MARRRVSTRRNGQVSILALVEVLDLFRQLNPRVLALFVDGYGRTWKSWFSKCANRYHDAVVSSFDFVVNGRTAKRAEVKSDLTSAVSDSNIFARDPGDRYPCFSKAGLDTERTACSSLTGVAMTDRNSDGLFVSDEGELTAAAGCVSSSHSACQRFVLPCVVGRLLHELYHLSVNGRAGRKSALYGYWVSPR